MKLPERLPLGRPPGKRYEFLAFAAGTAGVALCLSAVGGFVLMIATNKLPWYPGMTVQDHYLEIGRSYSQGFLAGFFLCFFLTVAAVGLLRWIAGGKRGDGIRAPRGRAGERAA
jgi:hypothetical protein